MTPSSRPLVRLASLALITVVLLGACRAPASVPAQAPVLNPPEGSGPADQVHANWKQRLDQPYVYVDLHGSYAQIGVGLDQALRSAAEQGLHASGPVFALYFDDPGTVAVGELRARACVPVSAPAQPRAPLAYDVLESTTVAYAYVSGAYSQTPRAYPAILTYMRGMNWVEDGPIREIYLIDPADVRDVNELMAEVQIPAAARP